MTSTQEDIDFIRSQKWTHADSQTGQERHWQQEDEDSCASREEAVAMVQRTIDFWVPMMRDQLMKQKGMNVSDANRAAKMSFTQNIIARLDVPFGGRWYLRIEDFTI